MKQKITTYLKQIKITWKIIIDQKKDLRLRLNAFTMHKLSNRCSIVSEDYSFICEHQSRFFSHFQSSSQSTNLMTRIHSIRHVILSLHTFFEDIKYLNLDAKMMKILLSVDYKSSIHEEFLQSHNNQRCWRKEIIEDEFERDERSQQKDERSRNAANWKAHRQLWLFVMRHFSEMTEHTSRKDIFNSDLQFQRLKNLWWYNIAQLADACEYKHLNVV
jgi:hypothetical protein